MEIIIVIVVRAAVEWLKNVETLTLESTALFLLLAQRTNTRAEPELFQLNIAAREFDLSTFPFLPEFTVVGFSAPLMTMMMMIFAKTTTTHR